jgi:hypothetical protein
MKRLHLDFVAQSSRLRVLRWLLLVCGLAVLAGVLAYQQITLAPRALAIKQVLQFQQAALAPAPVTSTLKPQELAAAWRRAQAVSDELALPWSRLFASMGEESGETLAFLSIEPDAIKGQVVVVAEAKDFDAMLKFFEAMQSSADFADVTLQSHLINRTVAEKPVRFRLSARWKLKG